MLRTGLLLCVLLFAFSCADSDDGSESATTVDVGQEDSGVSDTSIEEDVLPQDIGTPDVSTGTDATSPDAEVDAEPDAEPDLPPSCDLGRHCNPHQITSFPYSHTSTTVGADSDYDAYSCAPDTNEAGPEVWYQVTVQEAGVLQVRVDSHDGVDIDVHLLRAQDANACVARDHIEFSTRVEPGTYYVVADSWVDASGDSQEGGYDLTVSFQAAPSGACAVESVDLKMFWSSCDGVLDCYRAVDPDDGQTYSYLRTPATGPVVREAHLVTEAESFPNDWPTSARDGLQNHYDLSQQATGYVMNRTEPWAPAGEGGSRWGQGSTGRPIPVVAEAWYVNMYWRVRPPAGTRMIVRNPTTGRAVVAAAGYETGPGANTAVGGASEEIHHYLGTTHRDTLEFGFAIDQNLAYGPIECE